MPQKFDTIGLIGKHGDVSPRETLIELGRYLMARGHRVLLEESTASRVPNHKMIAASLDDLGVESDLAIVVGGDGTLLHTARSLADYEVPLLGINLGRLGFLADVSPKEMLTTLEQIFSGEYREESRFLLSAEIDGVCHTAFNDVVVHKWNIARMIEFETYIDGSFVNVQRSDGIIISTPTGSTAYALSGGGPLLHTDLNATLLVPICPHTLSNRPIVVDGDSEIEIVVCDPAENVHLRVTCDGQTSLPLKGDRVTIRKHVNPVRLIHPINHDHFYILRTKLGWSEHNTTPRDK
ncbi:MAG: NAD(+) kinase [Sedimenticola sp.]|nr:NAD(+) kinase [Sedimenticola sp.]